VRRPVPEEAIAAVFARAAELDAELAPGDPHAALDVEALVEVGAAVGLSPEAIRRAVAEHHAGALVPASQPPTTWVGPRGAAVERRLEADPARVRRALERSLERQWFRKVRGGEDGGLWCARDDLAARVGRQVDFRKRLVLKGVSGLQVTTTSAEPDEVVVRIEADLAERRTDMGWLVAGTTTGGTVVGTVLAVASGLDPVLAGALLTLPGAAAGAGGGVAVARRTYAEQLRRLGDDLEGMLDRLEQRAG
jgi:hypothetical protein